MLKWTLYGAAGLGALIALTLVVGWLLPVAHTASRTRALAAPAEDVFAVISEFGKYPDWRSDVTRVEVEGPAGVGQVMREHGSNGRIPYRVEVFEPPAKIVARIDASGLPFGGTWTYEVKAGADGGSEVTITEDGEVYNPFFRFMSRFVFGHHATMDRYLADLATAVGEKQSS